LARQNKFCPTRRNSLSVPSYVWKARFQTETLEENIMKAGFFGALALFLIAGQVEANEPYLPRNEKSLQRLDMNKDGRISLDEVKPRMDKRLALIDANGDKAITSAEIDVMLQKRVEGRRIRMMELMDGNRDGSITQAEFDRVVEDMFDKADVDNNGGVDLAELQNFKRGPWRKNFVGSNK
jgi:Ca2+-binding EF-hand superfamily protein